jgi:ATP-dependent DNA ligase
MDRPDNGTNRRRGRELSLVKRKSILRRLLRRSGAIAFNDHLEGKGETIFQHACQVKLEGIVSKRADAPYRSGRSDVWLKTKKPSSAAMKRHATARETRAFGRSDISKPNLTV